MSGQAFVRDEDGFVLKLTAVMGPIGERDNRQVTLEVLDGGVCRTTHASDLRATLAGCPSQP